ncbi:MAG: peptide chain release factor N(5)-glutamine methyltransferase, partial [Prevotella sp.]|nr:peptide chain release factor N(5)-glutamine methyltransferase [Prevotella sp.]
KLLYHQLLGRLAPVYGLSEARALLRMAMERRFGLAWNDVLCDDFSRLTEEEREELERIICRLEKSEPIQYILGEAEFCGRMFAVNPSVLIPRPETEDLVNLVISSLTSPERVLDIGTGSGCIALTLALHFAQSDVTGFDISAAALAVARSNALRHNVKNICFRETDVLNISDDAAESWDVIVSNPPYVAEEERSGMARNVLDYEPGAALFVPDSKPLLFYTAILRYARCALRHAGRIFFEINPRFVPGVETLLEEENYGDIRIVNDRFARERLVSATKI